MKRSGMNLRSTTSIQPKLTDVQLGGFMADDTSPLKQIQVSNNEEGGVDAIEEATLEGDPSFEDLWGRLYVKPKSNGW